jgi:hypothetical protein
VTQSADRLTWVMLMMDMTCHDSFVCQLVARLAWPGALVLIHGLQVYGPVSGSQQTLPAGILYGKNLGNA